MNYYSFHIRDYAGSTLGLTWDGHMAYRVLLDLYYDTEAPIPLDKAWVYQRVMARTKTQRKAVDLVLDHYFLETEDGWVNDRCERVLAEYRAKGEARAAAARSRWAERRKVNDQKGASLQGSAEALAGEDMATAKQANAPGMQAVASAMQTDALALQLHPTNNQEPITTKENLTPLTPLQGGEGALPPSPPPPPPVSAKAPPPPPLPLPSGEGRKVPAATLASETQRGGEAESAGAAHRKPEAKPSGRRSSDPSAWSGVTVARPDDVPEDLWRDFCALRKAKSAPLTERVLQGVRSGAARAGANIEQALTFMIERGHQGFIVDAYLRSHDSPVSQGKYRKHPVRHEFSGLNYGAGGAL